MIAEKFPTIKRIRQRSPNKQAKVRSLQPPPLQSGDHLSRAEFERIYQLHPEIKKAELIEGVVFVASPLHLKTHANPHFNIITWLGTYAAQTPGTLGADNATLRLDLENEPQPDVILALEPVIGGKIKISADDYLEGVPELIVEIAASTASYDLNIKKKVYARNGVREYLVFLSYEQEVRWFVLGVDGYGLNPANEQGVLQSKIFPGLWLNSSAFWKGDLAGMLSTLQMGLVSSEHMEFVRMVSGQ